MMRKAQIEITGLAIVMILLMVGIVFAVRFMTEGPTDYKNTFTQTQLASNMLNTLLKTTSDCEISMTELLQHCSQTFSNPVLNCSGNIINSCNYVEQETQQIFLVTLEKWNIDYELKVYDEKNSIFTLGNACSADKKSELFPIPTTSRTLFVKLDICT